MRKDVEIRIHPDDLWDAAKHRELVAKKLKLAASDITHLRLRRRSIDARQRIPVFNLLFEAFAGETPPVGPSWSPHWRRVADRPPVLIAGMGPAGMFAAMKLLELGFKPVILERGKAVRDRRRDLASLNKEGIVNPDSNYCFGEGGAGTFSDGKLYTRSTKRGDTLNILHNFVFHGASEDILIDAHPHIGTNKLPDIIQAMRETILAHGGEIHFDTAVSSLIVNSGKFAGVKTRDGKSMEARALILATGHSARDIFSMLHAQDILIEAKPFALGVRVEHPQEVIDEIRYHMHPRHENLPAAAYSWVQQVESCGVYSFCMCPGGIICPSATAPGEVVVNGWSPSKRNSPFANSGIVVEMGLDKLQDPKGDPLAGVKFQLAIEEAACAAGGGRQVAPASRLMDFIHQKTSKNLPECSYLPGIRPVDLGGVLPADIISKLRGGFKETGRRMKGYLTNEAVVVAVESRTSSPVRIPRDPETLMHPQVEGLFPCGEGAGYAGGIMSAAIDGEKCAAAAVLAAEIW